MALTKTQVSQLYVTLLGRASEANGNAWWQKGDYTMASAAKAILDTATAKAFFGSSLDDNMAFINHIYQNVLGRTYQDDPAGVNFWVNALKTYSRGDVVSELIKSAEKNNEVAFTNKVKISDYVVDQGDNVDAKDRSLYVNAVDKAAKEGYDAAKAYVDSLSDDNQWVSTPKAAGETKTLTTSTDEAVANVFEAPMGYNPGGTDYINTLQDEDRLVGIVGRSDNTVNATFGRSHGDEATGSSRTPNLVNIQYFNAKITGDTGSTIDLRYANELTKVNLHHITNQINNSNGIRVTNISSKLEGMRVANYDDSDRNVTFEYKQGILSGNDDKSLLELNDVNAKNIDIVNKQNDGQTEGIEKLTLVAKNGVDINQLKVNDLQELTVKGSGNLEIASLEKDAKNEYNKLSPTESGINPNETNGFTNFDASAFKGKVTVDISKLVTDWVDPNDSANFLTTTITGSAQDDVFYTSTMGGRSKIVGGNGNDKLVLVDGGIAKNDRNELAEISGIESLEVRNQRKASQTVDFDAIKDNVLEKVTVRDEKADADNSKFVFKNVSKEFADNKKFVIEHSVTKTADEDKRMPELDISLKDGTGANDKVTVEVVKAPNKQEDFGFKVKTDAIENVNIIDSDDDNNTVVLIQSGVAAPKADVVVKGGVAGKYFELVGDKVGNDYSHIKAATIDASEYLGDFRVTVDGANQKISLGQGNDIVSFYGVGNLTGADKVTGGAGTDIVRGVLSSSQALDVTGVEELYVASTNTINLDISKGDFEKFTFISKESIHQSENDKNLGDKVKGNLVNAAADVTSMATDKIVTVEKSALTEVNFSADFVNGHNNALDLRSKVGYNANMGQEVIDSVTYKKADFVGDHTFNGVTLKDNAAEVVTVNVNGALDDNRYKYDDGTTAGKILTYTANTYNIGQVTIHKAKTIDIKVADDRSANEYKDSGAATVTTFNNIYAKDVTTLTASSKGDVNLKEVTGNGTNNNLMKVDATKVLGDFKATVRALGDSAVVDLGDGNNFFSAKGSAGKNITINAGKGNNEIIGSEQSDTINTGNGANIIHADKGDNVINVGDGSDVVKAYAGSDTYSLGRGYDRVYDNTANAGAGTQELLGDIRTSVTKAAGAAYVEVGDGKAGSPTVTKQWIAVGEGSDLSLRWDKTVLNKEIATLDGAFAVNAKHTSGVNAGKFDFTTALDGTTSLETGKGDANNNLWFVEAAGVNTINAGAGNDVALVTNAAARLNFKGGDGNDAAVGGGDTDVFEGGTGADVFVTQNGEFTNHTTGQFDSTKSDGNVDVARINTGDSLIGSHDVVYGFDTGAIGAGNAASALGGASAAGGDVLDLANSAPGAVDNALYTGGNAKVSGVEGVATWTVTNNVVKFKNAAGTEVAITEKNLAGALKFLADKLDGTNTTVAFEYDRNGEKTDLAGTNKSDDRDTFVFQDGIGSNDTVVQLVGVKDVTGIDDASGAAGTSTAGHIAIA
jgi:S-layer protein